MITVLILLPIFILVVNYISNKEIENAQKITFEDLIDLNVKDIHIERNFMYLNGQKYHIDTISWYSKKDINGNEPLFFGHIKPPFRIKKNSFSDTIFIIKNDKKYIFLLNTN